MVKEIPILFKPEMVAAILSGQKTQTRRIIKPQPKRMEINKPIPVDQFTGHLKSESEKGYTHVGINGALSGMMHPECKIKAGDVLWVRETWKPYAWDSQGYVAIIFKDGFIHSVENGFFPDDEDKEEEMYWKLADELDKNGCPTTDEENYENPSEFLPWRPSIFMPKNLCRLKLKVTRVRAERLFLDTSVEDAIAEGIERVPSQGKARYRDYMTGGTIGNFPITSFHTLWDSIHGEYGEYSWYAKPWVWVIEFKRLDDE